jgi:hypothetical protein
VRIVGYLRFFVVFLLGVGVMLGAYATGGLDYIAQRHPFRSWYASKRDTVLHISSDAAGDDAYCTARYVVDNRSSRRIFVVLTPSDVGPANGAPLEEASRGYDSQAERERVRYASDSGSVPDDDVRYGNADYGQPRDDATFQDRNTDGADMPAAEIRPGEQKTIDPLYAGRSLEAGVGRYVAGDNAAMGHCGATHVVTLELNDCAKEGGACVNTTDSEDNQGDE